MEESKPIERGLAILSRGFGKIVTPDGKVAFPNLFQRENEEDSEFETINKINFIRKSCGVKVEQRTIRFKRYKPLKYGNKTTI